ncbi:hypothetical protein HEK616_06920 [Streptomyces nigrescens]|uniref:Uncharacterized protein n=1 Tax=Streptomyces nigrescens TaxID=1920 RepID=A0ABM7ZLE2_STRNI|nr:hypothetical protein [Streptomyces nigrescens]BDM67205.1 hypothetical protein HEK616_06920 [Streptomyces nigrescens]
MSRALVVAVGSFRSPVVEGEELAVGAELWGPLDFVYRAHPQVQRALGRIGYPVDAVVDPGLPELRMAVGQAMDEGHRIIHVISHGRTGDRQDPYRLDVVTSDALTGMGSNVSDWVSAVQASGRPTLFLLDLCRAGLAARLPFMLQLADEDTSAWVIAAAGGGEDAFDGRFSLAVAEVLEECARTGLGSDPSQRYVSFSLLARRIGDRVSRMAGVPQTVHATPLDPSRPEPCLPFVPNPCFVDDPLLSARRELPPSLRAFLDSAESPDLRDAGHFTDRAGRHFTGRRSQLSQVAPWLDGLGQGGLGLVTGRPGSGKSALLGAVVCAAHPALARAAPHIRARLAVDPGACPSPSPLLAAVHARQRTPGDLLPDLARQLRLAEPATGWTPDALVAAITGLPEQPVIVLDALDEAVGPRSLMADLLLPLATARRPDTRPSCRLLVGVRPWDEFAPLRKLASADGLLIDLDAVDADELRRDLADYLRAELADLDGYSSGARRAVRDRLAEAAADRLTGTTDRHWGAFLVASVFTRYLAAAASPESLPEARQLGHSVPTTLQGVLELDLQARSHASAVRALLTAVAHAKGEGMPMELALPLATALCGETDGLPSALPSALFYLRTSVDRDGTTLYRLFHQGLADYFRSRSTHPSVAHLPGTRSTADLVLNTLLTRPGGSATPVRWDATPPYLLRHAIQHALDAGRADELLKDTEFLVHADPDTLAPALAVAETGPAELEVAVYRASGGLHRWAAPATRRSLLAVDAARYRAQDLLEQLNAPLPKTSWRPRWATGSQVSAALRDTLRGHTAEVDAVACTVLDDRPVAVTGGMDETVRVWDLHSGQQLGEPLAGHTDWVEAVACISLDGEPVVISASADRTLRRWSLTERRQVGAPLMGHTNRVSAVSLAALDGGPVAVSGSADGTVRVWDLRSGQQLGAPLEGHTSDVTAIACTELDGGPVAVSAGADATVRVWDLRRRCQVGEPFRGHARPVLAVACTELDGGPVAVSASGDGEVRLWDLSGCREHGGRLAGPTVQAEAITCTTLDGGRPVAVTGADDGTVRLWDLAARRASGSPLTGHTGPVLAVACGTVDGRPTAVSAGVDETVRVWDLGHRRRPGDPLPGHTDQLEAVACTVVEGRPVAVTGGMDDTVRFWDLAAGRPLGNPLRDHGAWVRAVACTVVDGRPVAVSGGSDGMVRLWDPGTRMQLGAPIVADVKVVTALACTTLAGRAVAVAGADDGTVRLWDLDGRRLLGDPLAGHRGEVLALACTVIDNRPVAVTAGEDGTVRLWDLLERSPVGGPLTGHTEPVLAIACTVLQGRPVAVTGADDCTVRLWDLRSRRPIGVHRADHRGSAIAVTCAELDGRPTALVGWGDGTVLLQDLTTRMSTVVPTPADVFALALAEDGSLVVAGGFEVIVMERGVAR